MPVPPALTNGGEIRLSFTNDNYKCSLSKIIGRQGERDAGGRKRGHYLLNGHYMLLIIPCNEIKPALPPRVGG